ncbi:hypothetical protein CT19431_MP30049 [Cupriavidus taiwanensis]|nr:hypothetical protein CT19431_MP30049 [Cupriavidus taiwanensis]
MPAVNELTVFQTNASIGLALKFMKQ